MGADQCSPASSLWICQTSVLLAQRTRITRSPPPPPPLAVRLTTKATLLPSVVGPWSLGTIDRNVDHVLPASVDRLNPTSTLSPSPPDPIRASLKASSAPELERRTSAGLTNEW